MGTSYDHRNAYNDFARNRRVIQDHSYYSISGACRQNVTRAKKQSAFRFSVLTATTCLISAALAMGSMGAAQAMPQDGNVVSGNASIDQVSPDRMDINQTTNKAIIEWDSFSIDQNEHVHFNQPGADSITLNRVTGDNVSNIRGKLTAQGNVWLLNKNGVMFGESAQVDVGGLVATTSDIKNSDFEAGDYKFYDTGSNAKIVNEGNISVKQAGVAALVAKGVENRGVIEAKMGKVHLAGGSTFTVDMHGDGLIQVAASEEQVQAYVKNSGIVQADGGSVHISVDAASNMLDNVINMDGVIKANSIGTKNGKIVIGGSNEGVVSVTGTIEAKGTDAGETGGYVEITGEKVGLFDQASIDVSGDAGGGEVQIGGDYQGQGNTRTAEFTYIGEDVTINADAISNGDGGRVIVWSDNTTRYFGNISAVGGAMSGDGGFTEVSGKLILDFQGLVDLRSTYGEKGTLLLDPTDVQIVAGAGADDDITTGGGGSIFLATAVDGLSTIYEDNLETQLGLGSVIISTGGSGGNGDVFIRAEINASANASDFIINASRHISIEDNIDMSAGSGDLHLRTTGGQIQNNGGTLIMGSGGLMLTGGTGVGSDATAIQTQGVTSLAATSATGDINIHNTGSGNINITSITDYATTTLTGVSLTNAGAGDNITIRNDAGDITITEDITFTDGGTADGYINLDAGYTAASGGNINDGGGNISIDGAGLLLQADNDIEVDATGIGDLAARTLNAAGNNSINIGESSGTTDIDITTVNGVSGITTQSGTITVNQTGGDPVTLTVSQAISSGGAFNTTLTSTGDMDIDAAITSADGLTLTADTIDIDGNLSGSGLLRIGFNENGLDIGIGDDTATATKIDDTALGHIQDGWSLINFRSRGDMYIGSNSFSDSVEFETTNANSDIYLIDTLTGTGDASFNFDQDGSGIVYLNADIDTSASAGNISFDHDVQLQSDTVFTTGGGSVIFSETLDGDSNGPWDMSITAGAGDVDFVGNVGSTNALDALTIVSAADVSGDNTDASNTSTGTIRVASLSQTAGIGTSNFGDITLVADGNIDVSNENITLNDVDASASTGYVSFKADANVDGTGVLTQASGTIDITGGAGLALQSGSGIGSDADAFDVEGATSLAAASTTGDIFIHNTASGNINITTVDGLTGVALGAGASGDNITIRNDAGNITLTENITFTDGGTADGYVSLDAGYTAGSASADIIDGGGSILLDGAGLLLRADGNIGTLTDFIETQGLTNFAARTNVGGIRVNNTVSGDIDITTVNGVAGLLNDTDSLTDDGVQTTYNIYNDAGGLTITEAVSNYRGVEFITTGDITVDNTVDVTRTDSEDINLQTYGALDVNAAITLAATNSSSDIHFAAESWDIDSAVTTGIGDSRINIRYTADDRNNTMGIGTAASGTNVIDDTSLGFLSTNKVIFGDAAQQRNDLYINTAFDWDYDVEFNVDGGSGDHDIYMESALTSTNGASFEFDAESQDIHLDFDITTNGGSLVFSNSASDIELGNNIAIDLGTGTFDTSAGATITGGAFNLNINADEIDFGGTVDGTGILTLSTGSLTETIGVAGGAGTLDLSVADLDEISGNWSRLSIGDGTNRGRITSNGYDFDTADLRYDINATGGGTNGSIDINGDITNNGHIIIGADTELYLGGNLTATGGYIALGVNSLANSKIIVDNDVTVQTNSAIFMRAQGGLEADSSANDRVLTLNATGNRIAFDSNFDGSGLTEALGTLNINASTYIDLENASLLADNINLTAGQDIQEVAAVLNLNGGGLSINTGTGVVNNGVLSTTGLTDLAVTNGTGDITIHNTGSGDINITTVNGIDGINLTNAGAGDNITIRNDAGDITITEDITFTDGGTATNGAGAYISLDAGYSAGGTTENIIDGGGSILVDTAKLLLRAGGGIGTNNDKIETQGVSDFAGISGNTSFNVRNTVSGDMNITTVNGVSGVTSYANNVRVVDALNIVNDAGAITVSQAVTNNDVFRTTSLQANGLFTSNATINGAGVTIYGDDFDIGANISSTGGNDVFRASTYNGVTLGVGDDAIGFSVADLSSAELDFIQDGFLRVEIGDNSNAPRQTGSVYLGSYTFKDDLRVESYDQFGNGDIYVVGDVVLSGAGDAFTVSQGFFVSEIFLDGSITTNDGNIDFGATTTNIDLQSNVALSAGAGTVTTGAATTLAMGTYDLSIAADEINIGNTISGSGDLTLAVGIAGTDIQLGSTATAGALNLTDAELDFVTTTGNLIIGDTTNTGEITVDGGITYSGGADTIELRSSDHITFSSNIDLTGDDTNFYTDIGYSVDPGSNVALIENGGELILDGGDLLIQARGAATINTQGLTNVAGRSYNGALTIANTGADSDIDVTTVNGVAGLTTASFGSIILTNQSSGGGITVSDAISAAYSATLDVFSTTASLIINDTVTAGTNAAFAADLTLDAGVYDINAAVSVNDSGDDINIWAMSNNKRMQTFGIGTGATGTFNIDDDSLGWLDANGGSINFGNGANRFADLYVSTGVDFADHVTFNTRTNAGADIYLESDFVSTNAINVTFSDNGVGSVLFMDGNVTTAGGNISFARDTEVGVDVNIVSGGGNITFDGAVTTDGTARDLSITAGAGNILFNDNLGTSGARFGEVMVASANNVTVANNSTLFAADYIQNAGTGTTAFGSPGAGYGLDVTNDVFINADVITGKITVGNEVELNKNATTISLSGLVQGAGDDASTYFSWTDGTDTSNANVNLKFNGMTINEVIATATQTDPDLVDQFTSGQITFTQLAERLFGRTITIDTKALLAAVDGVDTQQPSATITPKQNASKKRQGKVNPYSASDVAFGQNPNAAKISPSKYQEVANTPVYKNEVETFDSSISEVNTWINKLANIITFSGETKKAKDKTIH